MRKNQEFAALLKDFAELKTGDRVTIHMPMVDGSGIMDNRLEGGAKL